MMEQELIRRMNDAVKEVSDIILEIQTKKLQHTQETLNFVDKLNRLSVMF